MQRGDAFSLVCESVPFANGHVTLDAVGDSVAVCIRLSRRSVLFSVSVHLTNHSNSLITITEVWGGSEGRELRKLNTYGSGYMDSLVSIQAHGVVQFVVFRVQDPAAELLAKELLYNISSVSAYGIGIHCVPPPSSSIPLLTVGTRLKASKMEEDAIETLLLCGTALTYERKFLQAAEIYSLACDHLVNLRMNGAEALTAQAACWAARIQLLIADAYYQQGLVRHVVRALLRAVRYRYDSSYILVSKPSGLWWESIHADLGTALREMQPQVVRLFLEVVEADVSSTETVFAPSRLFVLRCFEMVLEHLGCAAGDSLGEVLTLLCKTYHVRSSPSHGFTQEEGEAGDSATESSYDSAKSGSESEPGSSLQTESEPAGNEGAYSPKPRKAVSTSGQLDVHEAGASANLSSGFSSSVGPSEDSASGYKTPTSSTDDQGDEFTLLVQSIDCTDWEARFPLQGQGHDETESSLKRAGYRHVGAQAFSDSYLKLLHACHLAVKMSCSDIHAVVVDAISEAMKLRLASHVQIVLIKVLMFCLEHSSNSCHLTSPLIESLFDMLVSDNQALSDGAAKTLDMIIDSAVEGSLVEDELSFLQFALLAIKQYQGQGQYHGISLEQLTSLLQIVAASVSRPGFATSYTETVVDVSSSCDADAFSTLRMIYALLEPIVVDNMLGPLDIRVRRTLFILGLKIGRSAGRVEEENSGILFKILDRALSFCKQESPPLCALQGLSVLLSIVPTDGQALLEAELSVLKRLLETFLEWVPHSTYDETFFVLSRLFELVGSYMSKDVVSRIVRVLTDHYTVKTTPHHQAVDSFVRLVLSEEKDSLAGTVVECAMSVGSADGMAVMENSDPKLAVVEQESLGERLRLLSSVLSEARRSGKCWPSIAGQMAKQAADVHTMVMNPSVTIRKRVLGVFFASALGSVDGLADHNDDSDYVKHCVSLVHLASDVVGDLHHRNKTEDPEVLILLLAAVAALVSRASVPTVDTYISSQLVMLNLTLYPLLWELVHHPARRVAECAAAVFGHAASSERCLVTTEGTVSKETVSMLEKLLGASSGTPRHLVGLFGCFLVNSVVKEAVLPASILETVGGMEQGQSATIRGAAKFVLGKDRDVFPSFEELNRIWEALLGLWKPRHIDFWEDVGNEFHVDAEFDDADESIGAREPEQTSDSQGDGRQREMSDDESFEKLGILEVLDEGGGSQDERQHSGLPVWKFLEEYEDSELEALARDKLVWRDRAGRPHVGGMGVAPFSPSRGDGSIGGGDIFSSPRIVVDELDFERVASAGRHVLSEEESWTSSDRYDSDIPSREAAADVDVKEHLQPRVQLIPGGMAAGATSPSERHLAMRHAGRAQREARAFQLYLEEKADLEKESETAGVSDTEYLYVEGELDVIGSPGIPGGDDLLRLPKGVPVRSEPDRSSESEDEIAPRQVVPQEVEVVDLEANQHYEDPSRTAKPAIGLPLPVADVSSKVIHGVPQKEADASVLVVPVAPVVQSPPPEKKEPVRAHITRILISGFDDAVDSRFTADGVSLAGQKPSAGITVETPGFVSSPSVQSAVSVQAPLPASKTSALPRAQTHGHAEALPRLSYSSRPAVASDFRSPKLVSPVSNVAFSGGFLNPHVSPKERAEHSMAEIRMQGARDMIRQALADLRQSHGR